MPGPHRQRHTERWIIGLRVFDQVYALSNGSGGPVNATATVVFEIYEQSFDRLSRYGYGAAFALLLTALIGCMALTQLALLRRNEARL